MKIAAVKLKKKFGKQILIDEKLSKYSWFNLGGPAEILFKPNSTGDIRSFFEKIKPHKFTILGAGSNTLIRDGGIEGITIKLSSAFSHTSIFSENIIEAGAATPDKKVSDFAMENSLTGLEFLACIPGSIGGAVRMNTGCYGADISQILHSIKAINSQGIIKEILAKDIKFSYRNTNLEENLLVTSVKLKGKKFLKHKIEEKQKAMVDKKKRSQPSQIKTCGSTFKNLKNKKAWELISESDCKNFKVGNAKISEKHCNFFVNNGNATSKELEELINKVKKTVFQKTKINLELEIKIIGYNNQELNEKKNNLSS
jgi:UDP-N-acetylmuramate dehydrogenase